jgi:hypothetical protein
MPLNSTMIVQSELYGTQKVRIQPHMSDGIEFRNISYPDSSMKSPKLLILRQPHFESSKTALPGEWLEDLMPWNTDQDLLLICAVLLAIVLGAKGPPLSRVRSVVMYTAKLCAHFSIATVASYYLRGFNKFFLEDSASRVMEGVTWRLVEWPHDCVWTVNMINFFEESWTKYTFRVLCTWVVFFGQYAAVGGMVQLCTHTVYKDTPYFHSSDRTSTKKTGTISDTDKPGKDNDSNTETLDVTSSGYFYSSVTSKVELTVQGESYSFHSLCLHGKNSNCEV